jgi:HK97 family phage major capsid protein
VRSEAKALLDAAAGPNSIWPTLARQGQSMTFGGAQSILIPQTNIGVSTGATAWVGEAGTIPVVKGAITGKRLWKYKLAGIIPITKELERASDPAAVAVMREMLRQFLSNLLDTSMLDASAEVVGVRPAGLLNGVVAIPGAAGGGYNAFHADLDAINSAFTAAGVGSKPVILVPQSKLFTLRTMTNALGQFIFPNGDSEALGFQIVGSEFIAANTMIGVAAEKFASAIDGFDYSTSDQATITMANADGTAPTQAGASPLGGALGTAGQVVPDGGIPVAGGNGASIAGSVALSLWQTWQTGIRLVVPASFGITRAGAVQQVTGTTW